MGTNCAPLIAVLFLLCYERDFMMSLSDELMLMSPEFYGDLIQSNLFMWSPLLRGHLS